MAILNNTARVFIRKVDKNITPYRIISCLGIPSLSYSNGGEFVRCNVNGKTVSIGYVLDTDTAWEGNLTTFYKQNENLPINNLECLYDMLILFGACTVPFDYNDYQTGILLQNVAFSSTKINNIIPSTTSELNMVYQDLDFSSANVNILNTPTSIVSGLVVTDGVITTQCNNCDFSFIGVDGTTLYYERDNTYTGESFTTNNNRTVVKLPNGNVFILSDRENVIISPNRDYIARITTTTTNITDAILYRKYIYYVTSAGTFGRIHTDTFVNELINTGTRYTAIVVVSGNVYALGSNVYVNGRVIDTTVAAATVHNGCIIYSTGTTVFITTDGFTTSRRIGTLPIASRKLYNYNGILYSIGTNNILYSSLDLGITWRSVGINNSISQIDNGYAIGSGVYRL